MNDSKVLHRLLYYALLDIRSQGLELDNKVVFRLADLFHNTILKMEQAAQCNWKYSDILTALKRDAQSKGCQEWLNNAVEQIQTLNDSDRDPAD